MKEPRYKYIFVILRHQQSGYQPLVSWVDYANNSQQNYLRWFDNSEIPLAQ